MGLNANVKYSFNLKEKTSRKFQVLWNTLRLSTAEGVSPAPSLSPEGLILQFFLQTLSGLITTSPRVRELPKYVTIS